MAKWIEFVDIGTSPSGKTKYWSVKDTRYHDTLGTVQWYGPWRKYTFQPLPRTIFEEVCLRDIAEFIEERTKEHRAK